MCLHSVQLCSWYLWIRMFVVYDLTTQKYNHSNLNVFILTWGWKDAIHPNSKHHIILHLESHQLFRCHQSRSSKLSTSRVQSLRNKTLKKKYRNLTSTIYSQVNINAIHVNQKSARENGKPLKFLSLFPSSPPWRAKNCLTQGLLSHVIIQNVHIQVTKISLLYCGDCTCPTQNVG